MLSGLPSSLAGGISFATFTGLTGNAQGLFRSFGIPHSWAISPTAETSSNPTTANLRMTSPSRYSEYTQYVGEDGTDAPGALSRSGPFSRCVTVTERTQFYLDARLPAMLNPPHKQARFTGNRRETKNETLTSCRDSYNSRDVIQWPVSRPSLFRGNILRRQNGKNRRHAGAVPVSKPPLLCAR